MTQNVYVPKALQALILCADHECDLLVHLRLPGLLGTQMYGGVSFYFCSR